MFWSTHSARHRKQPAFRRLWQRAVAPPPVSPVRPRRIGEHEDLVLLDELLNPPPAVFQRRRWKG